MALSLGRLGMVRHDMAEKILAGIHQVETLQFRRSDFEQIRIGNKEFRWGGHLYDIASINTKGDSLRVCAFKDECETRLLAHIDHLVRLLKKDASSGKSGGSVLLSQLFHLTYLLPESSLFALQQIEESPSSALFAVQAGPLPGVNGILTPPPEGCPPC